jgi:hypothetical protein
MRGKQKDQYASSQLPFFSSDGQGELASLKEVHCPRDPPKCLCCFLQPVRVQPIPLFSFSNMVNRKLLWLLATVPIIGAGLAASNSSFDLADLTLREVGGRNTLVCKYTPKSVPTRRTNVENTDADRNFRRNGACGLRRTDIPSPSGTTCLCTPIPRTPASSTFIPRFRDGLTARLRQSGMSL